MPDHRAIITQLGGIRELARKLEHQHHTRVQGWYERNRIPVDSWSEVVAVTANDPTPLTASDLMPADLRPAPEAAETARAA